MTTLLVDGDINAYQIAASIEIATNWGDGLWTLHSDENIGIARIEDQIESWKEDVGADRVVVALSDTVNFRCNVLPTYKHNRKDTRKPLCLPAMRAFLEENYECFIRPGLEGDDILGILATSRKIIKGDKIIASIDKDIRTIPCTFYRSSHRKEGVQEVSEASADHFHLMQTLGGDATDGYSGCPGIGMKRAAGILAEFTEGDLDDIQEFDLAAAWETVLETYEKKGLGEEEALTQARVARILRATDYDFKKKEPILWTPY